MTLVVCVKQENVTPMVALATILIWFLKLGAPCHASPRSRAFDRGIAGVTCWEFFQWAGSFSASSLMRMCAMKTLCTSVITAAANASPEIQMWHIVLNFFVQETLILLGMSEVNKSRSPSKHTSAYATSKRMRVAMKTGKAKGSCEKQKGRLAGKAQGQL